MRAHRPFVLLLLLLVAATVRAGQASTPEETVRAYYAAIGDGDAGRAVARLADSAKREADAVIDDTRARCTEVHSIRVIDVQTEGDTARVHVVMHGEWIPRFRGRRIEDVDRRLFRLRRTADEWRIESMPADEDLLVDTIVAEPAEASAIIAQRPQLIGPRLVRSLLNGALILAQSRDAKPDRKLAALALDVALAIDDRDGIARSMATQVQSERVPGSDSVALQARAQAALAIAEEAQSADAIAHAALQLGMTYMDQDESSRDAELVFRQALRYRDSMRSDRVAVLLANLGGCLFARQDYAGAYQAFSEAAAIRKLLREPLETGFEELYLGRIQAEQNDPQLALEHFRRAAQRTLSKPFRIMALLGSARALRTLGRADEASNEAQQAMEVARPTPYKGLIAQSFVLRAELQVERGEGEGAEETLRQALAYAREVHYAPAELNALLSLGTLFLRRGRAAEALVLAGEAEAVWRRFDFPGAERYVALMLAARAELALGNSERGMERLGEAILAIESVRDTVAGSERQQLLFFEPHHAAYELMVDLLLEKGRVDEALVYAERAKGRVLLDALGRERTNVEDLLSAEQRRTRETLVRELGIANRRAIGARAKDEGAPAVGAAELEQHRTQLALERFDSDAEARAPQLRSRRGTAAILEPAALAEIVDRDDLAILEFVVHERRTTLFVITRRNGAPVVTHHRIEIGRTELNGRVQTLFRKLSGRDLLYVSEARSLYALLLAPAAAEIRGARVLCLVPDGPLWQLPFEALVRNDGTFFVEQAAFFYASSISVHREIVAHQKRRRHETEQRPVAAFGNPDIGEGARQAAVDRSASLGPLPDAEREARTIARLWGRGGIAYTGRSASEHTAKREMARSRIVHLAAHGLVDDANPMYSQIVLAPDAGSSEDGVLQAWELMRLDIAADLVVLSACETARGRIGAGEGLIGMSWALFAGGSPSTIVTHWNVGSASTATLMVAFHRELEKGQGVSSYAKARALRAAQLELMHDPRMRHPFYWAGFVLIGSGS
jgi:CHAT domain-containing protein/Tfp pilus assembly protein PilF